MEEIYSRPKIRYGNNLQSLSKLGSVPFMVSTPDLLSRQKHRKLKITLCILIAIHLIAIISLSVYFLETAKQNNKCFHKDKDCTECLNYCKNKGQKYAVLYSTENDECKCANKIELKDKSSCEKVNYEDEKSERCIKLSFSSEPMKNISYERLENSLVIRKLTPKTKKSYLDNCTDIDSECDALAGLSCQGLNENKTCQCLPNQYWDDSSKCNNETIITSVLTSTKTLLANTSAHIPRKVTTLISDLVTNWGTWGLDQFCDYGSFVVGFRTRVEAFVNKEDDTALNSIELICSNNKRITSKQGIWGGWGQENRCPNGFVDGFIFKAEPYQNVLFVQRDDSAANAIRLSCSDGKILYSAEGDWGEWSHWKYCPLNTYVCGLKTQVHDQLKPNEESDYTALNNVILYCCNI